MDLIKSISGGYYLEKIPEEWRIAVMDDFYDEEGFIIYRKNFLVHSFIYPERYWAYRVKKGFPYPNSDFKKFLEFGRVYVFE